MLVCPKGFSVLFYTKPSATVPLFQS